jgi:hypothetical protein
MREKTGTPSSLASKFLLEVAFQLYSVQWNYHILFSHFANCRLTHHLLQGIISPKKLILYVLYQSLISNPPKVIQLLFLLSNPLG